MRRTIENKKKAISDYNNQPQKKIKSFSFGSNHIIIIMMMLRIKIFLYHPKKEEEN